MSATELVALLCCDLGSIVRGRSLPVDELDEQLATGVSWVPANHALTPLGPLAEPNPFDSTGDLRLLPDPDTRVKVAASEHSGPLELLLCDIVETDGQPWECCPRRFLRDSLDELEHDFDLRLRASFEHEFQLLPGPSHERSREESPDRRREEGPDRTPAPLPFSLHAQRAAEPFAGDVMAALQQAGAQPERFFPEFAPHQFEIPVQPSGGLTSADRSVVLKEVVREIARRHHSRACFSPLLDPAEAGNGAHIHLNLLDAGGLSVFYDPQRPASLSDHGARFAAGILAHAGALSALTAPSPVSAARLQPHRWSAGAVCLAERSREALLRIPPLLSLGGLDPAGQLHLEYRGADAAANPYLALGAIVRAGLEGLREELPVPTILDRDPAQLNRREAERYGVGALPDSLETALQALERDETVRGWMPPLLYDAYVSVKRAELAAVADLDLDERCRRYAFAY